jgi:hypothetical protein
LFDECMADRRDVCDYAPDHRLLPL